MALRTYRYVLRPPALMVEEGTGPGQGDLWPQVTNGRLPAGAVGASPTFDVTLDDANKAQADAFYAQFGWAFLEEIV